MKRLIVILFLFCLTFGMCVKSEETENQTGKIIRQGTFIKVMVPEEFSTLTSDVGDELWFINTQDMYIYETNVVPKDTKIYAEVEDVLEPVQGRDGAIKIQINKMITPDKRVYKFKGHIYSENDNYIGGDQTSAVFYRKVPHYNFRLKPFLQAAPLKVLEMGKHTIVKPGEELFLIFDEDVQIK